MQRGTKKSCGLGRIYGIRMYIQKNNINDNNQKLIAKKFEVT